MPAELGLGVRLGLGCLPSFPLSSLRSHFKLGRVSTLGLSSPLALDATSSSSRDPWVGLGVGLQGLGLGLGLGLDLGLGLEFVVGWAQG